MFINFTQRAKDKRKQLQGKKTQNMTQKTRFRILIINNAPRNADRR